ncbi:MAG: YlbF family regulator [Clostridiales bacterium]|nr:YlbF family regulator [Clostridiales bacterium]
MNVYDQAHTLAQAIRESEEFKQFDSNKKTVEENPQLNDAVHDFMKKQFEMQTAQMTGQQMDPALFQQIQELSAILMQDPAAAQYLQCQMRFSMMMADVYKIIGEVADFGFNPLGGLNE